MNHYDRVCAYVNLDNICHNMDSMKAMINENTQMIAVIKTDGYGHGSVPIAGELEKKDYVWGYAVATFEEGVILRKAGMKKPILILGYTFEYCYDQLSEYEIRPAVFRMDQAMALSRAAMKNNQTIKIHIKVDTAMSRIGITPDEKGLAFIKKVSNLPGIEIEGIFTHFARADEQDLGAANAQLERYEAFLGMISEAGIQIPIKHCSNSAGILQLPQANMDIVRAGITLYGLWPSDEIDKSCIDLKPALSLKSHIVYIKTIQKGTAVSYGGTFVAQKDMKVATIPVGYGDGYPRGLSNKGEVLIAGQRAKILGRVCMDQFMVDVTELDNVKEGDEVTLIGKDKDDELTMEELGEVSGRFNYELACDLTKRIPRVYIRGGEIISSKDYYDDY